MSGTEPANTSSASRSRGRSARLSKYKGLSLQAAADEVIKKQMVAMGGDGGAIAITRAGDMAWSFKTPKAFIGHERSREARSRSEGVTKIRADGGKAIA